MPIVGRVLPTISSRRAARPRQHRLHPLLGRQHDRQVVGPVAVAEKLAAGSPRCPASTSRGVERSHPLPAQVLVRERPREQVEDPLDEGRSVDGVVALDVPAQHCRRLVEHRHGHERLARPRHPLRTCDRLDEAREHLHVHGDGRDPELRLHRDHVAGDLRRAARSGADADDRGVPLRRDPPVQLRVGLVLVAHPHHLRPDAGLVLLEPPVQLGMKLSEFSKPTSTRNRRFPCSVSSAGAIPRASTFGG